MAPMTSSMCWNQCGWKHSEHELCDCVLGRTCSSWSVSTWDCVANSLHRHGRHFEPQHQRHSADHVQNDAHVLQLARDDQGPSAMPGMPILVCLMLLVACRCLNLIDQLSVVCSTIDIDVKYILQSMSHYFIVCRKLTRELANFVCRNVGITNTEWNGTETYEKPMNKWIH